MHEKTMMTKPAFTTRRLSDVERASAQYPSVALSTGELLHVYKDDVDGDWWVWLNTEASDFDGLCIGTGDTREAACADAVKVLEAAAAKLQEPAW